MPLPDQRAPSRLEPGCQRHGQVTGTHECGGSFLCGDLNPKGVAIFHLHPPRLYYYHGHMLYHLLSSLSLSLSLLSHLPFSHLKD